MIEGTHLYCLYGSPDEEGGCPPPSDGGRVVDTGHFLDPSSIARRILFVMTVIWIITTNV
jgi:hypothetical protein